MMAPLNRQVPVLTPAVALHTENVARRVDSVQTTNLLLWETRTLTYKFRTATNPGSQLNKIPEQRATRVKSRDIGLLK